MQSEFDQRYLAAPDVLFQRVGDEGVLLDLASERYFSLNEVGARFWELLAEDASLARALAVLVQEYEVSDQVLRADLDDLLAADRSRPGSRVAWGWDGRWAGLGAWRHCLGSAGGCWQRPWP